ncbi:MAG: hypothetical protein BGN93_19360 [Acinetobacter sp. 39-4]|jgi:hypothetical protein|uniref:hypothetical protein n=1 Tax=Acinetobacter modestus TaxID=1776740 RepID=UPI000969E31B|nr:MAG: hypothetical protein BGN93_19360 [Acinetobacter sp. 39-4]OJU92499.1 MAG: hypothetical protein BGO19_12065 [Acinetobacter sp. 38-8]
MNNQIKAFLQCSAVAACMSFTSLSHADIKSMNQFYNNPASAPKVTRCKGNINCNAFYALSKEWQVIPKNYKLDGYRLRSFIEDNDGDSLNRDFAPPQQDRAYQILEAGAFTYKEKARNDADFLIFVKGLAVLHYIDRSQ